MLCGWVGGLWAKGCGPVCVNGEAIDCFRFDVVAVVVVVVIVAVVAAAVVAVVVVVVIVAVVVAANWLTDIHCVVYAHTCMYCVAFRFVWRRKADGPIGPPAAGRGSS